MNTTEQKYILSKYTEQAKRAHYWISFSPDKRGLQTIADFSEMLENDLKELPEDSHEQYQAKFERLFTTWLSALSRTASSAVTGSARFPVERNRKRQRSEENHYQVFKDWRERAKKAILRKSQPVKTFNSEIERYKAELESMKLNHELMKEGNKRIKQALKSGENIDKYLIETFGIKPHMLEWTMKFGFGLANNNANMKRVEERIKLLETKQSISENVGIQSFSFEGGTVEINWADDRIRIKHDTKPSSDVIQTMKRSGLKWSPTNQAWQRQNTANARWTVERLLNITFKKLG